MAFRMPIFFGLRIGVGFHLHPCLFLTAAVI